MATNESNKFVVSNTNGNFYIDLDHNKLVNIGSGEIISISPNSRNIILKRNENLFSIKINYSLSRVKLISNETPISYLKPVNWETTIWSHNSNYFVFQYLEDTAVYSADNSGNNVVKIIDAAQLTGAGEYVITPDNLNLVIRLTDSNKNTTLPARTNLYKIGFVR